VTCNHVSTAQRLSEHLLQAHVTAKLIFAAAFHTSRTQQENYIQGAGIKLFSSFTRRDIFSAINKKADKIFANYAFCIENALKIGLRRNNLTSKKSNYLV
jgi:hypothetical protein